MSHWRPRPARPTVLVVEDHDIVRPVLEAILARDGYTVLTAATAPHALGLCEQYKGPIHLLLADIGLKQLNGYELARRLAPRHPDMKVLFITGYGEEELHALGVPFNELPCLLKPFTAQALLDRVGETLRGWSRWGDCPRIKLAEW